MRLWDRNVRAKGQRCQEVLASAVVVLLDVCESPEPDWRGRPERYAVYGHQRMHGLSSYLARRLQRHYFESPFALRRQAHGKNHRLYRLHEAAEDATLRQQPASVAGATGEAMNVR